MAAVDGLFDDRKDVFGVDLNLALFQHRHGKRFCRWAKPYGAWACRLKGSGGGVPELRLG